MAYNIGMVTTTTTRTAAGGTSNIPARQLTVGMTIVHMGAAKRIVAIEDTTAPAWARPSTDCGQYTVTLAGGYRLSVPRPNTVEVVA